MTEAADVADVGGGSERWLLAGQQLLRDGGIRSVKLDALCSVTGLTTGSFYHHFSNMADYVEALAAFWGAEQVEGALAALQDAEPADRLRGLARVAAERSMGSIDAAMRDWAGSEQRAAEAVRAADTALLEFVAAAFGDMGFERDDARVRAVLLVSSAVARVHAPWRLDAAPEAVIEILTTDRASGR